ncbi:MAG TPA: hypothetical protein VLU94_01675 [Candidatus Nitrosotalea sp.]|nr:hypothetical protein [Candidatus Nitrosotalea sp.]
MERRHRIGPWGESGLAEATALLTGSDVALFSIVADEKIHFDLQKPYASPRYVTALSGRNGFPVTVEGVQRSHVTAVINSRLATSTNLVQSGDRTEPVQILDKVDLHGLFFHQVTRQTIDSEGNILEEDVGSVPSPGAPRYTDGLLVEAAAHATPTTIFRYYYDPGVLIERNDNQDVGRVLTFTDNAGNSSSAQITVNLDQQREMLTRIEASRAEAQDATTPDLRRNSLFRVVHHPRIMEWNPYLPAQSNVWTGWTVSELDRTGKTFLDSETVLDASGDMSAVRVNKKTSSGGHGTRIAYRIPRPNAGALRDLSWSAEGKSVALDAGGQSDFGDSDFIYCYISGLTNLELLIADGAGREFTVGGAREAGQSAPFWSIDGANIRWLPNNEMPRQGTVVSAPPSLLEEQGVIAVSVHDLDRAGLNIRRLTSFKLRTPGDRPDQSRASPIFRLNSGNRFIADDESNPFQYRMFNHSTGLRTLLKERTIRTEAERIVGLKVDATVEFNDHPVAFGFTHAARETYPIAVIANDADPGAPDRFYALAPDNGRFLESFRTVTRDDHYTYTVTSGFEVPRLEVRRPDVLDDEIGPGLLAYGKENPVTVSLIKGHNLVTHALADSRNRIAANAFKLAGERVIAPDPAIRNATRTLREFNDSAARSADDLVREVDSLPMLARVLLPTTTIPWQPSSTGPTNDLGDTPELRSFVQAKLRLAAQAGLREFPKTGLTPVTFAPRAKSYVETVKEANLILLEVKAEEYQLARDLLDFYEQKSAGGEREIHSSYDARSGAPLAYDPSGRRPLHSPRTSEAQIAIADAAFQLALATGDADAFSMGASLLNLALAKFRPPGPEPRGIADLPALETNRLFSVTFWPRPQSYSLKSNARAYLLLCQLIRRESIVRPRISAQDWANFLDARHELEDWLRKYFLSSAEQTGVVPRGLVQVQNIDDHTTALARERWTAAEDWLVFLEAADQLGTPREKTRQWLEHLARLHGVQVRGVWGLDWSIALFRPDAISTELAAKFLRVARLLEHSDAVAFATRNLLAMRTNETWPVMVADADPALPLFTGQGSFIYAGVNPMTPQFLPGVFNELLAARDSGETAAAPLTKTSKVASSWSERADYPVFLLITGTFYLSILVVAIFWWRFRAVRHRWQAGQHALPDQARLVSDSVMQLAEERWAKRVLGARSPESAERTRYSNAPVEANFLMQLRAIHKLVVEWRRRENGWSANDPRLAEDEHDDWLNGLDEFCSMVGIYMRWVIKSGAKDGFPKKDVLAENEDSNHIWSRLVLYFSEYRWGLLTLLNKFDRCATDHQRRDLNAQFVLLLNAMGMRQRATGFDARESFNFPENPSAMDLLIIQRPGTTLAALVNEMAMRLEIPGRHIVRFIKKFKDFKRQDNPYPIHPYLIEAAKLLPHFFLMALGALVFYNYQSVGDRPMISYLWEEVITHFVLAADFRWFRWCGLLLLAGLALTIAARSVRVYRWEAAMISRRKSEFPLDKTLTGLFTKTSLVLPLIRPGWRWDPMWYDRMAWALRATGFFWLGVLLLNFETPGFATFLLVKGLLAVLAFAECAAIVLPLAMTWLSRYLQDRTTDSRPALRIVRWLNQLNITATRPTSLLWQSLRYHFRPSVLSGDLRGMCQVIATYFILAAAFFFAGGILCQEMFPLWFTEQYRSQANWKLMGGAVIFWITMYLLRFGLFVFVTGVASWVATFPIKGTLGLLGLLYAGFVPVGRMLNLPLDWNAWTRVAWPLTGIILVLVLAEERIASWVRRLRSKSHFQPAPETGSPATPDRTNAPNPATLGVVYMSGDDLSSRKLTPDLLMTRWMLLKNKFSSDGLHLISGLLEKPDDQSLEQWFSILHKAEDQSDVTLWHPSQLMIEGEIARFPVESGLNITVKSAEERDRLLSAWHLRRWLVTMMSTAGHSQDTGVNLVDIALRLEHEGLSARTVFYLIQNKYDDAENNRPSQSAYDRGELGQRNKLARLLEAVAPGSRAHSLQNWTPFGFKAGGLTGTDLIHEESLKLTTLLLLDRNATVHDLDALMADVQCALNDPNVVIVVPGRSTTNTRTAIGQGSQMVEEGHRSFLKGLMTLMGGNASECLGTGWGNILGNQYGLVQRALVNGTAPEMPLTSRMRRGASFALKLEGLIGFGPHAVGISEDTWAVSQATHNAIALGLRPRFLLSRSIWHKIRETWSHSEWLSSFPRWSGGYLQMMHDPIMQQINDFGPLSVFAREMRANSGRFYLTALFTLLNILLMPLAIILDVTPFVEILIVLWNFGFVMNQILTVHGLQTYLESSGFRRVPALIGALLFGGLSIRVPDLKPAAPALAVLGFLVGGFGVGLGRWWSSRLRDVILFGPQLVLHALGQFVRQSLEFVVSGASPEDAKGVNMAYRCAAGPREDRPVERFNTLLNLRTVVWVVGFLSLVLNMVALSGLDLLNVLMLLPSLLFSVSALVGPFVMAPPVGNNSGFRDTIGRVLGWASTILFYVGVSCLIGSSGAMIWIGAFLVIGLATYLLWHTGRYAGYHRKVDRVVHELADLLAADIRDASVIERLTRQILKQAASDPTQVRASLEREPISNENRAMICRIVDDTLAPLLRAPAMESRNLGLTGSRFRSTFARSSVLALSILLWFFLVPVPGLFVLSAGAYRVATHLGTVLLIVSSLVALALAGSCFESPVQWPWRRKREHSAFARRAEEVFRSFQSLLRTPGRLNDQEVSSAFALFTDVQTYVDQHSDAYARRSLGLIENILGDKPPK